MLAAALVARMGLAVVLPWPLDKRSVHVAVELAVVAVVAVVVPLEV